ncbi:thioesterase II family protein [Streptomyces sp. NPDC004270]
MTSKRGLVEITHSPSGERVLYAIPHAGAGAGAVKAMCRAIGDRCDTVGVRLPGRESRTAETPMTDLDELADTLAAELHEHAGPRRIYLYGHCAGAVIAYQVARRLKPDRLAHLVVSAHQSPDRIPETAVWRLPRDAFMDQVRQDGYLPREIAADAELFALVEPALRADYQAIECHTGAPEVIDVPILALLGREEHSVAVGDVKSWAAWTTAGFRLSVLPGGHNLLTEEAGRVASAIGEILA